MERMEQKILSEGKVLPGGILKVGSFLNQQIDTVFLGEIGREVAALFGGCGVTKILTIESSGIAIAAAAGMAMGVPTVVVSSDYLLPGDKVLLVDDFLANGKALLGLMELARQAGAQVVGAACAIEKGFQGGGDRLRTQGVRVESLAIIEEMSDDGIRFRR